MSIDPIVQQLRAARLAARRSQRHVAVSAGLNQATICEAETGKHGATLASARRWAAALGYDLALVPLSTGEGPGSTSPEPGPPPCRLADWCVVTGPHDASRCAQSTEEGER